VTPEVRVQKVYNNNVVAVVTDGEEVVLVGRGIGFQKKPGDPVDESRVSKRFHLAPTPAGAGARSILVDLPLDVITLTGKISAFLAREHGLVLPSPVEIGLADHLAAALGRLDQGVPLFNNLLWETRASYPGEFAVALGVLELVRQETGQVLPLDEAGFITMHLVNAGLTGDMAETLLLARALDEVLAIVAQDLPVPVRPDSPHYARFLTHVKFVLQRLAERTQLSGQHAVLFEEQRRQDPAAYRCALRVTAYLEQRFDVDLSEEEQLYLMIHLSRLRARETEEQAPSDPAP
jgi:beta-glucoside operon transcriptional antiterminator